MADEKTGLDVVAIAERHEAHHADVYALIEENRQLRRGNEQSLEARRILADLMRRTHGEGPVNGTGFANTGLAVDMTAEVLLAHLDNPAAKNIASFVITKEGEERAIVTIQRPTGQSPIELLRAANEEIARLKATGGPVTGIGEPRLNRGSYEKLIAEDIAWLKQQPRTLERDHTLQVLEWSVDGLYQVRPTVPAVVAEIAQRLVEQDTRATDAPIFIVEEKHRVYGFDPAYTDDIVWIDTANDCVEADAEEHARLEAAEDEPDGWTRTGYRDEWRFVTACFTEAGCEDYIARNKHRHRGDLRIYAAGSYRNDEWRAVRDLLISLATKP